MRPVTIDNLDIKNHERYAQDQVTFDSKYITESASFGIVSEIAGTSVIYPSNWEILFDIQIRNLPWAYFSAPLKYNVQSNRFFSYRILPTISFDEEEEEDEEQEERENQEKEEKREEFLKKISSAEKGSSQTLVDFESEKSSIINLLDTIRYLDKILCQINCRMRQYQKG